MYIGIYQVNQKGCSSRQCIGNKELESIAINSSYWNFFVQIFQSMEWHNLYSTLFQYETTTIGLKLKKPSFAYRLSFRPAGLLWRHYLYMLIGVFISAMFHLFMVLLLLSLMMMMVVVGTLRMGSIDGSIVASLLKVKLVFFTILYVVFNIWHVSWIYDCYLLFYFYISTLCY